MADDSRGSDGLLAFLIGGILGAGLALLLAPTSGDETREHLSDWLRKTKRKGERMLDKGEKILERERENLAEAKDRIETAFHAGKKAFRGDS